MIDGVGRVLGRKARRLSSPLWRRPSCTPTLALPLFPLTRLPMSSEVSGQTTSKTTGWIKLEDYDTNACPSPPRSSSPNQHSAVSVAAPSSVDPQMAFHFLRDALQRIEELRNVVASVDGSLAYLQDHIEVLSNLHPAAAQQEASAPSALAATREEADGSAKRQRSPETGAQRARVEDSAQSEEGAASGAQSKEITWSAGPAYAKIDATGVVGASVGEKAAPAADENPLKRRRIASVDPPRAPRGHQQVNRQAQNPDLAKFVSLLQSLQRKRGLRRLSHIASELRKTDRGLTNRVARTDKFSDFVVVAQTWLDLDIEIGKRRGEELLRFRCVDRPWLPKPRTTPLPTYREQVDQLFLKRDGHLHTPCIFLPNPPLSAAPPTGQ